MGTRNRVDASTGAILSGMRFLALDPGAKRIGVAVSDPLEVTARGIAVVKRTDLPRDLARIAAIAKEEAAEAIVVGLPLERDGREGDPARRVRIFAARVGEATGLPVHMQDERLTTVEAAGELRSRGTRRRSREGGEADVDRIAAAVILQDFLDRRAREPD